MKVISRTIEVSMLNERHEVRVVHDARFVPVAGYVTVTAAPFDTADI